LPHGCLISTRAKRKYGYFSLPVSVGDVFFARMNSKADRKQRTLIIHNLHFELIKPSKSIATMVSDAIKRFAKFNQCEEIVIVKSNDKKMLKTMREALA
jgi:uncharacterized protein YcaQ